jgi:hypothetical protein
MKYILTTFLLLLSLYTQGQVENIITDESEISYDSSDSTWVIVRTKVTFVNQVNSENKWILRPIVGKDLFIIPNFLGENRYLLNTRGLSKTPANTFVSLDAIYPIGIEPTLLIMTKLSN